jgi:hypothetical protein
MDPGVKTSRKDLIDELHFHYRATNSIVPNNTMLHIQMPVNTFEIGGISRRMHSLPTRSINHAPLVVGQFLQCYWNSMCFCCFMFPAYATMKSVTTGTNRTAFQNDSNSLEKIINTKPTQRPKRPTVFASSFPLCLSIKVLSERAPMTLHQQTQSPQWRTYACRDYQMNFHHYFHHQYLLYRPEHFQAYN